MAANGFMPISVEKFVGFVNQGFNYPMNEAVAFRWSAPTDLAPRSTKLAPEQISSRLASAVYG